MNKNISATMEPNLNLHDYDEHEEDDAEDALSFCNFPIHDGDDEFDHNEVSYQNPNNSSDQNLFEFFANPKTPQINPTNQIVFCGKIIQHKQDRNKPPSSSFDHFNPSKSPKVLSSKQASSPATGNYRNSSTLSSSQSRRRPFSFGLVKFPPEMQLSDMRKRQSRRPPAPLFPVVNGDLQPATASTGCGRGGRGNWGGLLRMLRSRSHLGSTLAKTSLGCISLGVKYNQTKT